MRKYVLILGIFEIIFCLFTTSYYIGFENFSYIRLFIILIPSLACIWIAISKKLLENEIFGKFLTYAFTLFYFIVYSNLVKDLDFDFFKETLFFLVYILSLGVFLALKGKILLKEQKKQNKNI